MKAFEVIHPGMHTAIQDLGRPGFMKYGTPASGAADRFSARVANWLVGNPAHAALLEVTLFRLELLALNNRIIAITGGNLSPVVNGNSFPMWQAIAIQERGAGDYSERGNRDYGLTWRFEAGSPGPYSWGAGPSSSED